MTNDNYLRKMDGKCFNCHFKGHLSANCPQDQKTTRCYLCKRVCPTTDHHYWAYTNRTFISQPIENPGQAIRTATLAANVQFFTKSNLYLMDGTAPIDISGSFAPMQIDSNHGLLLGRDKKIEYYQWYPSENHRCVMNVMAWNNVRLSIRLVKDFVVINKKIRVRCDGTVEYRNEIPEN